MDRRTFLLHTGRWLAVAGLAGVAPFVPGCAQAVTTTTTVSAGEEGPPTTSAGGSVSTGAVSTGSSAGATAPTGGGTTASTAGGTTPTGGAPTGPAPDLAVVKGDVVDKNLRAAIALLGGMERYVKKGGKVVVKPNVLTGRPPEYATTTSPELMKAVIAMCWEAGAKEVVVLDNPTTNHRSAFDVSGLAQAVSDADGKLVYLASRDYQDYDIPQGTVLTKWAFVTEALEADTLIDLTLPKQHSVSGATMTMKNLMGVMGGRRGSIHNDFAHKIVDVNTLVKPTLSILDAYRVLFRNGPTGGSLDDVRLEKTLVAGTNPVSIDAYGTQFFGKTPADYKWLVEANARGMGEIDVSKLTIATGTA
jgi:uncharacterized protein (DUF362 family)